MPTVRTNKVFLHGLNGFKIVDHKIVCDNDQKFNEVCTLSPDGLFEFDLGRHNEDYVAHDFQKTTGDNSLRTTDSSRTPEPWKLSSSGDFYVYLKVQGDNGEFEFNVMENKEGGDHHWYLGGQNNNCQRSSTTPPELSITSNTGDEVMIVGISGQHSGAGVVNKVGDGVAGVAGAVPVVGKVVEAGVKSIFGGISHIFTQNYHFQVRFQSAPNKRQRTQPASQPTSQPANQPAQPTQPAKMSGVGYSIESEKGDPWGKVVKEEGDKWLMDTGKHCDKNNENKTWKWTQVTQPASQPTSQPAKMSGVGYNIESEKGEPWGKVVQDGGDKWLMDTGKHCDKNNENQTWKWTQ